MVIDRRIAAAALVLVVTTDLGLQGAIRNVFIFCGEGRVAPVT